METEIQETIKPVKAGMIQQRIPNEDVTPCDIIDDGESVWDSPVSPKLYKAADCANSKLNKKNRRIHPNSAMDNISKRVSMEIFDTRKTDGQKNTDENDCEKNESSEESTEQRAKINMRERKRMHDLNEAMESLREVMPCANGPSMRKISKIATLSLARNYIQMLTRSVEDLKMMLDDVYRTQGGGPLVRRRPAIPLHPYRHYYGISNNFNTYHPVGFEQCANIYSTSSSIPGSTCVGLGCCNGPNITQNRLQHSTCAPWNSKM